MHLVSLITNIYNSDELLEVSIHDGTSFRCRTTDHQSRITGAELLNDFMILVFLENNTVSLNIVQEVLAQCSLGD